MRIWGLILIILIFGACSTPSVRSTVDSYGEAKLARTDSYYVDLNAPSLIEKQSVIDCKQAARDLGLHVVDAPCKDCRLISVRTRLAGTEQAVHSTPGLSAWNGYGRRSRFGTGLYSQNDIESFPVAGREIDIAIFANADTPAKNADREIAVRSQGTENSVNAVAYEMCKAAFQDFPENLKGRFYELKRAKGAADDSTPTAQSDELQSTM